MKGLHVDFPSRKLSLTRPPQEEQGGDPGLVLGVWIVEWEFGRGRETVGRVLRQHFFKQQCKGTSCVGIDLLFDLQ